MADDPPPYVHRTFGLPTTPREPIEHVYALKENNRNWVTLKLYSSAKSPKSLPAFFEGEHINGSLEINAERGDSIHSVTAKVHLFRVIFIVVPDAYLAIRSQAASLLVCMPVIHSLFLASRCPYGPSRQMSPGCPRHLKGRLVVSFLGLVNGLCPCPCRKMSLSQAAAVPRRHTASRKHFWNAILMQAFSTTLSSSLGEEDSGLIVSECPSHGPPWVPPILL